MRRRTVLAALAQTTLLSATAFAQSGGAELRPRLKAQARDALGTTLVLGVPQAPFAGVGDDTVIVFVPSRYRFRADEGVSALVHFHGHNSSAARAIAAHALREQLVDSRQNAILVVPQLALFAADSACGKLTSPNAFARLVGGALSTAARLGKTALGESRFPERPRLGRVCLSAHSGGYHAAACSLRHGGVDVSETYLFDALYAESEDRIAQQRLTRGPGALGRTGLGGAPRRPALAPRSLARQRGLRPHRGRSFFGHLGNQRAA